MSVIEPFTTKLELASPAKLNLFLHITAQRADGYHELQTLFQLIDLYDQLSFEISDTPHIGLTSDSSIPPKQNLIYRAATALQQHSKTSKGCQIKLSKNIPMGAGLGGGSSNAATTLLALNHLWQLNLNLEQLAEIGLKLGADVPVFIYGNNAWAEGIGERLSAVQLAPQSYIILKPDCFISTQMLFSEKRLTRNAISNTFCAYQQHAEQFVNHFQPIVLDLYPEVKQAFDYLMQFGLARLTGTGACLFLAVDQSDDIAAIMDNAPCQAWHCHSLTKSPVHRLLDIG